MSDNAWGATALVVYAVVAARLVWRAVRTYGYATPQGLFTLVIRAYAPVVFGQRVHERCPWPIDGAALIVANHSSPVDPIVVHAASLFKTAGNRMRVVEWLTAREYSEAPGAVGFLCKIARSIPVAREGRDMAAIRDALRRIKEGRLIGIFPEGGLNDGERLKEFQTGVAFLALSGKLPVYPVFIEDTPRGDSMVSSFFVRSHPKVRFGDEVDLSAWVGRKPSADDLERVTKKIRDAVADLGGLAPDGPPAIAGQIAV